MPAPTDSMIAQFQSELEERQAFVDSLLDGAKGRDLNPSEMEMVGKATDRMAIINGMVGPLQETSRIALESRSRMADIAKQLAVVRSPEQYRADVEYRSASAYMLDRWKAGIGNQDAMQRLELFERAAAHQTTADNPGIIPEQLLAPILNYVDVARPIINALGPKALTGSGYVSRVTQHTQVAKQTAEKTELVSRKMLITKTAVDADTFGGYVNVSRQNIDWANPNALDVVINDLAGEYAIETEAEAATVLFAAATVGPTLPAAPTAANVATALWGAAGSAYTAMRGLGSLILAVSPDMLGLIGPLFAPINAQNAQSTGFSAGAFGQGAMGAVSGITVVMSAGLAAGSILVINSASTDVFEDRTGSLQVVEPSVLGVQVAYAGYFKALVLQPTGVIKIATTP